MLCVFLNDNVIRGKKSSTQKRHPPAQTTQEGVAWVPNLVGHRGGFYRKASQAGASRLQQIAQERDCGWHYARGPKGEGQGVTREISELSYDGGLVGGDAIGRPQGPIALATLTAILYTKNIQIVLPPCGNTSPGVLSTFGGALGEGILLSE